MTHQIPTTAAYASRSGAGYACARGLWRMPSSLAAMNVQQNQAVIHNGKSRAHRVQ